MLLIHLYVNIRIFYLSVKLFIRILIRELIILRDGSTFTLELKSYSFEHIKTSYMKEPSLSFLCGELLLLRRMIIY